MERETNRRGPSSDVETFADPVHTAEHLTRQGLEELLADETDMEILPIFEGVQSAEAGSDDVQMLPLYYAVELTQIRQDYDPEKMQELNARMPEHLEGDVLKIKLVNPPTINVLDEEHAASYLHDHNNYYRGVHEPVLLEDIPSVDGSYYIVVNGHRRRRTLLEKQQLSGIDVRAFYVAFTLKHNLSFEEAKREQYIENTSDPINPVHDAEAIERHYLWLRSEGRDYSVAALQEFFGYSPDKIRDALRFVVAPDKVKAFVGKGLTYSNAVDLVRLREAYATLLKCQAVSRNELHTLDEVDTVSEQRLLDYFESRVVSRLKSKPSAHIGRSIKAKIKEVKAEATFSNDELFELDEELERGRKRQKIRRDMGILSIETLRYLIEQKALHPAELESLRALLNGETVTHDAPDNPAESLLSDSLLDEFLTESETVVSRAK